MSTTTLFVELLIIGLEVCVWLVMLVSLILGDSIWLTALAGRFKGYPVPATIFVLAGAYLFGIVLDKVAHFLIGYERLTELLKSKRFERLKQWLEAEKLEKEDHPRMIHAKLMVESEEMGGDLLYARSKIRILRASALNVPLITVTAALLLRGHPAQWLLISIAGLMFSGLVMVSYLYTQRLYNRRLRRFKHFFEGY